MEENKNEQEQLEEIQEAPAEERTEEVPAAVEEVSTETVTEEPAAEETPAEIPAEPAKKATPGKIAVAVGSVILLAAVLIALIVTGQMQKTPETPADEPSQVVETVEATIPADGNPEDVTCKGS